MKKGLVACENAIDILLPAMKASIARELINKYSLTQTDVARKLMVTQAAVSKYLNGKYSRSIKAYEKNKVIEEASKKIAHSIAIEKKGKEEIGTLFCEYCKKLTNAKC